MTHILYRILLILLLPICPLGISAQLVDNPRMLSFETKNDLADFTTTKSKIKLTDAHYRNGQRAMLWEFKPQATLSLKRNLMYEPRIPGKRDNYLSAFILWVYSEQSMPGKQLQFEFLKAGKVCTHFPMNLNFKGWRGIWICYQRDMEGSPEVGMDEIKITAPDQKGELYFDHLITAIKVDPRQQTADLQVPFVNPKTEVHWLQVLKNSQHKPDIPTEPLTPAQLADIKVMEKRFRNMIYTPSTFSSQQMSALRTAFSKYNIQRKGNQIIGQPIWYVRQAEAYERMIPNWDKRMLTKTGFEMEAYFTLMQRIAYAYNNTTNHTHKEELKDMFLLMYDNITDQGVVYGSCWGNLHHYGYSMRNMFVAYFLMKDVLKATNRLHEAEQTMLWYSQAKALYVRPTTNGIDMDTFNTMSLGCLASILLMDDSPEKVQFIRSCSRWLDWGCRPAQGLDDSFKIDGSAYHHCNNYPAYAVGGLDGATQMLYVFSQTQFAVSELAHQTVKNTLLAMRFYCNLTHFPLSMSGRHPDGKGRLVPSHYMLMALAGTPDKTHTLDVEMARAYLRLASPKTAAENIFAKELKNKGITAEEHPQGNLSLPYACSDIQRRDNWAAVVRGHSRYLWASEHYIGENLYGRYLAHGSLFLSTGLKNEKITPLTSGWKQNGFDWNRIPGVTSTHLPFSLLKANIRNVDTNSGAEEMLLSDEAFAGGLSQQRNNGNFGMKLHEHSKYKGTLRARKSYHFFDNLIVCLGSGIENFDSLYHTETTIFQLNADDKTAQTYWNGFTPSGKVWLDHLNTGYYTPCNTTFTGIVDQESRTEDTDKPTHGKWVSLYIDHGTTPKNANYEYAILPQTTLDELQVFSQKPSYKVLANNNKAHIVQAGNITSYVLFEKNNEPIPGEWIAEADTSCLAMVKMVDKHQLILTVAQPDLAFYRGAADEIYQNGKQVERSIYGRSWRHNPSQIIPVTITLKGKWRASELSNVKIVHVTPTSTTVQIQCSEGLSTDIILYK